MSHLPVALLFSTSNQLTGQSMKNNDIMSFAEFRERHGTEVAEYVHQRIKQQHGIDFYAEIEAMLDAEYNLYVEHTKA